MQEDDDEGNHTNNNDDDIILPRYRLRSQTNVVENSIIIDEPPNVTNFNPERNLGQAPPPEHEKNVNVGDNQYIPQYLANAIVCYDTSKELEYQA